MFESEALKAHEAICGLLDKFKNNPDRLFENLFYFNGEAKSFLLKGITLVTVGMIFESLTDAQAVMAGNGLKQVVRSLLTNGFFILEFLRKYPRASQYLELDDWIDFKRIADNDSFKPYIFEHLDLIEFFSKKGVCLVKNEIEAVCLVLAHPCLIDFFIENPFGDDSTSLILDREVTENLLSRFFPKISVSEISYLKLNLGRSSSEYNELGHLVKQTIEISEIFPLRDFLILIKAHLKENKILPKNIMEISVVLQPLLSNSGLSISYEYNPQTPICVYGEQIELNCLILASDPVSHHTSEPSNNYIVSSGETFPSISRRLYGNESFAKHLAEINGHRVAETLFVGLTLSLTPISIDIPNQYDALLFSRSKLVLELLEKIIAEQRSSFVKVNLLAALDKLITFYIFPLQDLHIDTVKEFIYELEEQKTPEAYLLIAYLLNKSFEFHSLDKDFHYKTLEKMLMDALGFLTKVFESKCNVLRAPAKELLSHIHEIYGDAFECVNQFCNKIKFLLGERFSLGDFCYTRGFQTEMFKKASSDKQMPKFDLSLRILQSDDKCEQGTHNPRI